jgi:hypothetical protein
MVQTNVRPSRRPAATFGQAPAPPDDRRQRVLDAALKRTGFRQDAVIAVDEPKLEILVADNAVAHVDGHDLEPAQLLRLTQVAFGRAPSAFVLHVPAASFDFGDKLTPVATAGVDRAMCLLKGILSY